MGVEFSQGATRSSSVPISVNQRNYKQNVQFHTQNLKTLNSAMQARVAGNDQATAQAQGYVTQGLANAKADLQGVIDPAKQAIFAQGAQALGSAQQQAISSGLGNTSFGLAMGQVAAGQAENAMGSLHAQLAQTQAGYDFQGGTALAGIGMQGAGLNNQLTTGYMGDLTNFRQADFAPQFGQNSQSYGSNSGQGVNGLVSGAGGGGGAGNIGDVGSGGNGGGNPYAFGSYTLSQTAQGNNPFAWDMPGGSGGGSQAQSYNIPEISMNNPISYGGGGGLFGF